MSWSQFYFSTERVLGIVFKFGSGAAFMITTCTSYFLFVLSGVLTHLLVCFFLIDMGRSCYDTDVHMIALSSHSGHTAFLSFRSAGVGFGLWLSLWILAELRWTLAMDFGLQEDGL